MNTQDKKDIITKMLKLTNGLLPSRGWDEVAPGIGICEESVALDKELLSKEGFTHILNTCDTYIETGMEYYADSSITSYYGFSGIDHPSYDISKEFEDACQFIDKVIAPIENPLDVKADGCFQENPLCIRKSNCGKVMIHCMAGASRSATIVLAWMIRSGIPLDIAFRRILQRREIQPNQGFLEKLIEYEEKLGLKK